MLVDIILVFNIVILLGVVSGLIQKMVKTSILAFVWITSNILNFYFLVSLTDGSNPYFGWFSVKFPAYFSILFFAFVYFTIRYHNEWKTLGRILIIPLLAIIIAFTMLRHPQSIDILSYALGEPLTRVLTLNSFTLALLVSVAAPMLAIGTVDSNFFGRLFAVDFRRHWPVVLSTLAIIVLIYISSSIFIRGQLPHIEVVSSLRPFVRSSIIFIFYWTLIDHFVCFALTKYSVDKLIPGRSLLYYEVLLSALVLVLVHHYLAFGSQIQLFLSGIMFAYLYHKTNSIVYGVVINSLLLVFTA